MEQFFLFNQSEKERLSIHKFLDRYE